MCEDNADGNRNADDIKLIATTKLQKWLKTKQNKTKK